jgi:hypothetical protein
MELLASDGLVRLAWLHRWLFEENRNFVIRDFGRSFRPQGSDEELLKYGNLIAERMMSYGLPESSPEARAALDEKYLKLLSLFEAHLTSHPYFLGGHPSAADYAIMGALHAHLGRDPAGLRLMQDNALRVFRWVEQMLLPEVQSPEFFSTPIDYPPDDTVPESALAVLRFIADEYGEPFVLGSLAFNQAMARLDPAPGYQLDSEHDQPQLPLDKVLYCGVKHEHAANLHGVWLAQRSQSFFQDQSAAVRGQISDMLANDTLRDLISVPVTHLLSRENNRLLIRATGSE